MPYSSCQSVDSDEMEMTSAQRRPAGRGRQVSEDALAGWPEAGALRPPGCASGLDRSAFGIATACFRIK